MEKNAIQIAETVIKILFVRKFSLNCEELFKEIFSYKLTVRVQLFLSVLLQALNL
jgi:hypothetical protein